MNLDQRGRLLLTSQGLNTKIGYQLLENQIPKKTLSRKSIFLFIEPYYSIEKKIFDACKKLGFSEDLIFWSTCEKPESMIKKADYIYITEGNTFQILKILQEKRLLQPIRDAIKNGAWYIGVSAGAVLTGCDIMPARLTDENEVRLTNLEALGLIDGAVCPHMTKKAFREILRKGEHDFFYSYKKIYTVADGKILIL